MRILSLSTLTALAALSAGTSFGAVYSQNFTFADGTTDVGGGTTIGSTTGVAQVIGNELRLTSAAVAGEYASLRIPALANSSLGWTATFTLRLSDAVGGNPPADGFSFVYGAIPVKTLNDNSANGNGNAESGFTTGNEISFQVDTWNNNDLAGNSPGVGIQKNGINFARTDGVIVPNDGSVTANVSISWNPTTASFTTTGLTTNANFNSVAHTFAGSDAFSWAFTARTGGATEDLFIDNLVITTIPEPSGVALLGLGLAGLALRRRRK